MAADTREIRIYRCMVCRRPGGYPCIALIPEAAIGDPVNLERGPDCLIPDSGRIPAWELLP